jgi:hypothetical protein
MEKFNEFGHFYSDFVLKFSLRFIWLAGHFMLKVLYLTFN